MPPVPTPIGLVLHLNMLYPANSAHLRETLAWARKWDLMVLLSYPLLVELHQGPPDDLRENLKSMLAPFRRKANRRLLAFIDRPVGLAHREIKNGGVPISLTEAANRDHAQAFMWGLFTGAPVIDEDFGRETAPISLRVNKGETQTASETTEQGHGRTHHVEDHYRSEAAA